MKASTILKRAAKLVENGKCMGGCGAILQTTDWKTYCGDKFRASEIFKEYFYNEGRAVAHEGYWWPAKMKHGPRIIALYLAAAIAKSEGD